MYHKPSDVTDVGGDEATAIGLTRVRNFFGPQGITLAEKTVNNFIKKALQLYEQEPPQREKEPAW